MSRIAVRNKNSFASGNDFTLFASSDSLSYLHSNSKVGTNLLALTWYPGGWPYLLLASSHNKVKITAMMGSVLVLDTFEAVIYLGISTRPDLMIQ